MRRAQLGALAGPALSVGLAAALVPARAHISAATSGLVLVIPVVAGVTIGGLAAGLVSVVAGFLVYDFALTPPYYTLTVGHARDWVTLGVYAVVMVLVARVMANLEEARASSRARESSARQLFNLSQTLLADASLPELARNIVDAVRAGFEVSGVVLLLAVDGQLEVAARSGEPVPEAALARLRPEAHLPVSLTTGTSGEAVQTLALATSDRPVGLLVLAGVPAGAAVREVLPTLANHLALTLERAQLHERVRQAELSQEVDRLRRSLVGAVSHDLRTPLATIKVASSTLLDRQVTLSESDTQELHTLIDMQTDRLTRIVTDVLDMTRIRAGVLEPRTEVCSTLDLVAGAVAGLRPVLADRPVEVEIPLALPMVDVDPVLIAQTLSNLLDNANRHGPVGTPIFVEAELLGSDRVAVSVADSGAGVPVAERESVFDTFVRFDTGGRAGLGLAIAKAFTEAHGQRIWVEDAPTGGARFVFTLPVADQGSGG